MIPPKSACAWLLLIGASVIPFSIVTHASSSLPKGVVRIYTDLVDGVSIQNVAISPDTIVFKVVQGPSKKIVRIQTDSTTGKRKIVVEHKGAPLRNAHIRARVSAGNRTVNKTIQTDGYGMASLNIPVVMWAEPNFLLQVSAGKGAISEKIDLVRLLGGTLIKKHGPDKVAHLGKIDAYRPLFLTLPDEEQAYILESLGDFEVKNDWSALSLFVSAKMNAYLNPLPPAIPTMPPKIAQPDLPPVQEVEKSVFESKKTFEARMANIAAQRTRQIETIVLAYKGKVDARNLKVQKLRDTYKAALQSHSDTVAQRRAKQGAAEGKFLRAFFPMIFGQPRLAAAHTDDGVPKYDAENEVMFATLYYGREEKPKLAKQIAFRGVREGDYAETFYKRLKSGRFKPTADFYFNGGRFTLGKVGVDHQSARLLGRETAGDFKKAEAVKVVLGYKDRDIAALKNYQKVDFTFQSSAVKDVQLETYIARELGEYNDDIPALLARSKAVAVDKRKWLFVIGIEDYANTNAISYSKKSAEMFAQVAQKRLGVDRDNTFFITDGGKSGGSLNRERVYPATAGSIKDQLRYLIRDVGEGDKIYFFYSGHGIPAIRDGGQAYILAKDQSPDFIHEDKFFRVRDIYRFLTDSKAGQVIAFMDSCFTGETDGLSVFGGAKGATRLAPRQVVFNESKMAVVTAGTGQQFSNVFREKGHRLFSYYLMKGLLKGYSTVDQLFREVRTNTRSTSRKMGGSNLQEPTIQGNRDLSL